MSRRELRARQADRLLDQPIREQYRSGYRPTCPFIALTAVGRRSRGRAPVCTASGLTLNPRGFGVNRYKTLTVSELIELLATFPEQSPVWIDVGEGSPDLVPVDVRGRDANGIVVLGF
jgi:hypothetical protein